MTQVERFGSLPDGRTVSRYTLGTPGGLALRVLDLGAVVQQLWVPDSGGERANVVLGCADVAGYLRSPGDYYGAVVGRFANRVAGAELVLGGETYALAANDGPHCLHGGTDGFHRRLWTVQHVDSTSLTLSLVSPDGDKGFPGELHVEVTYEVSRDEVRIGYRATTDATTVVSLTQHAHFNLSGEGSGTVEDQRLRVAADRFTPVGPDLIPTGAIAEVAGTPLDLRGGPRLGDALRSGHEQVVRGRGYDHNYVLGGGDGDPAAVLRDPVSGRTLEVRTDQPGIQVYTGNFFDGTHQGIRGRSYRQGDGVALETQTYPDGPHHQVEPDWPSGLLRVGEAFASSTSWRFGSQA